MRKLILASTNKHKIVEIKSILGDEVELLSLADIGFVGDIEENGTSCNENAKIKARAVREFCDKNAIDIPVIAEDTGLFVPSLGGEPGVRSARYAGNHDDEANRQKLLTNLENKMDRNAYFETVLCYLSGAEMKLFVGRTYGTITTEKIGNEAFGYDCLFKSSDLGKTFGEATEAEKSAVSHRGRAVEGLKKFLDSNNPNFDRTLVFNKK